MANKSAAKLSNRSRNMSHLRWQLNLVKRNWIGYVFVAPFLFIFLLFTLAPIALSLVLSLTNFNMIEFPDFVFMDNYIQLFLDDELFITSLKNTLIFSAIVGPSTFILSWLVAWFINELPPRVRAIVTFIFYAPSISGSVYIVWQTLFSGDAYGWVNGALLNMNVINEPILFFKTEEWIWPLVIMVALWTSLGTSFLSNIAGLQGIPRHLFEAAAIDGVKNRWQEAWYVTLPSMKPQLLFGAVMSITGSFGFGSIITTLCGFPSVNYCAYTLSHHLDDYGSTRWEVGYASAISFVIFLLCFGCNAMINKLLSKVGQ